MRHSSGTLPSILVLLTLSLVMFLGGCGEGGGEDAGPSLEDSWATVQQEHDALEAKRAELASMEDGEEKAAVALEVQEQTSEFYDDLVALMNQSGMVEGEPLDDMQRAAVRLKSAEDMRFARMFIDERADYKQAIDIYTDAIALDPDNEELKAALEYAESMRYMAPERFGLAQLNMTEDQVREAIGGVRPTNIKNYSNSGQDVIAWFYPREDGGAAAVWFRDDGGVWRVYQTKWDQVKPGE